MIGTPVFEQTRAALPDAPICRICGSVSLAGDSVCADCWMCGRDEPGEHHKWHCAHCGEFIDGLERHQLIIRERHERYEDGGEAYQYDYLYLCREHYEARAPKHAVAA